jgi:hypothetical protein
MTKLAILCAVFTVFGCEGKKGIPKEEPPSPVAPARADAAAPVDTAAEAKGEAELDPDDPDAARRTGKKTGLGAPDDKPEVIVEDLLRALAEGKVPASRFIDPKLGVIERIHLPGGSDEPAPEIKKHRCKDADKRATEYVKAMVKASGSGGDEGGMVCNNAFASTDDPEFGADEMGDKPGGVVPMKHVTCAGGAAEGEYGEIFHVEWVPDAERGFRIAAIVSTETGATTGTLWADVAKQIKAAKPCK